LKGLNGVSEAYTLPTFPHGSGAKIGSGNGKGKTLKNRRSP